MKKNSPAERHIAKIVIFFVGVTGLVTLLSSALTPTAYAPHVTAVVVLFGMAVTWFGREHLFQKVLARVPAVNPKYKLSSGTWNIYITFDDDDGDGPKERSGSVKMSTTLLGVRIEGGKLLDVRNNKTTMNEWYADAAEIVTYEGHDILYYLYKVPIVERSGVQEGEEKFEKIGFVCAYRKKDNDVFDGYFRDIRVRTDMSQVREGTIRLVFAG